MAKNVDELLEKAAEHIKELEQELQRLMTPPFFLATVCTRVKMGDVEHLVMAAPGASGPVIVPAPEDKKLLKKLEPGTLVSVNPQTSAIVNVYDDVLPGVEATVKRVMEDSGMLELDSGMGGMGALVYKSKALSCVKPGDVVILDRTGQVALRQIKKDRTAYSVETATNISWKDIGGQEEAKRVLREVLEEPIKYAHLHAAYGKRPVKGVLLHGAPGNGKTLLAKASANAIRKLHGKDESETAFIYVKGPEVLNMWVGNTEAQIRGLFARAKEHKDNYGYPALIFIDEADAILGKRGSQHGSVLSSTIVPTFLAEMDGLSDSGAFVMLATNRPDTLDPAIVREGRIDRKVAVNRPEMMDSARILSIHLERTKLKDAAGTLAATAAKKLHSDEFPLYNVAISGKGVMKFHVRELISGAMLAGVVDLATSIAIQRDIKDEAKEPSGIVWQDMEAAIIQTVTSNRGLNHDDDLMAFIEQRGGNPEQTTVQRL